MRSAIRALWSELRRGPEDLLEAARDPKLDRQEDPRVVVYVPASEDLKAIRGRLGGWSSGAEIERIHLAYLPSETSLISQHGLLWLPGSYVVPGGRFNEFYGWDSAFIQRGLWRDGQDALALSVCDQALYEVRNYGTVLNANRTYYLTRSQPPLLGMMVRECYERGQDRAWLQRALPDVLRYYHYWMVPPHINQGTGLSRYRDLGHGPAPEALMGEFDAEGRNHYDRARDFLATGKLEGFENALYYDAARHALTARYYLNDRSMRESGFDISHRFGPLNLDVVHFAPVCLNSLLWIMEKDLSYLHEELGQGYFAKEWRDRAAERAERIHRYLWDEEEGMFFDYHLERRERYHYPFLTTFLPLWAGLATNEQARRVAERVGDFLGDGGLQTSLHVTGCQWDAPFAWAPLHLWAVGGLANYGFAEQARDVAARFLQTVEREFARSGCFLEKYDAVGANNESEGKVEYGYTSNEIGFGWTNAVVLELLAYQETGQIDTPMRQNA